MNSVEERFGKDSLENLFGRLFDEVPVRNDLHGIPFVKAAGAKNSNYVWMKPRGAIEVHIGKFKTSAGIPAQDYRLSKGLCNIIKANMAERTPDEAWSLVPFRQRTSSWAWYQKAVEQAGYPNYPYGETHAKQDTMNGTRHTIATYRNSLLNTTLADPKPFASDLADLMLHTLGTSEAVYRNLNIFDEPTAERPPLVEPTNTPDGIKFVRVDGFVGRVVCETKNRKWLVDFGDGKPEVAYMVPQLKRSKYTPTPEEIPV
jgi:hypothetical protein